MSAPFVMPLVYLADCVCVCVCVCVWERERDSMLHQTGIQDASSQF